MADKLFHHIVKSDDVKQGYEKIKQETLQRFKGADLFKGWHKEYFPIEEGGQPLETDEKEVVTTVQERLDWTARKAAAYIDHELVRDATNCVAFADLKVDGIEFGRLPATFLLALEAQLKEIRKYYDRMPTLDLAHKWEETGRTGVLKHGPVDSFRTAKKTVPVLMYEATKEHPAQIKDVVEDLHIGTFKTTTFTGAVHPQFKADRLERIDLLIVAVKKTRMRANEAEVKGGTIGKKVFDFINGNGG